MNADQIFFYPDPHLDRQKKSEKKTKHLEELDVLYGGPQASWRSWKTDIGFKKNIIFSMYRRPILCTLYGAVDFLNVLILKKYIMYL